MTLPVDVRQRRREAALLLGATLLVYANSFQGVFQFDDFFAIVDEPAVQSVSAWWHSLPGLRPLLKLTYAANHQSGFGLVGFHAVNLAVHAACVLLAFAAGQPVRVISLRQPSQVGTILSLPAERMTLPNGVITSVARVRLDGEGEEVLVPLSNLEVLG